MRFRKFLSITSVSLGSLCSITAMAQSSGVPLKEVSQATLLTLSKLSQSRLPVHKHISCSQIYQNGQHVFTDCKDSDGYTDYSNVLDYGWLQNQPACAVSIEEPVVRIETNAGFFKTLFGSFLESDILVDAGELLQLDGGYTSVNRDSIELEAKAPDGNTVHIKCYDPEAKSTDLEHDLSGVLQLKSMVVKVHSKGLNAASEDAAALETHGPEASHSSSLKASGTPTAHELESSSDDSRHSSGAASEHSSSSKLPTGSDAHPADGETYGPSIDSSDVVDLERNS